MGKVPARAVRPCALGVRGRALHLAYAAADQRIMVTTSRDGRTWTVPDPVPGCVTTRSPALAVCVHRGHAQRLVTANGEVLTDEDPAGLHELDDPDAEAG